MTAALNIKEAFGDKKKVAMVLVPLFPLVIMIILSVKASREQIDTNPNSQMLVELKQDNVEDFDSKSEAYAQGDNKLKNAKERNKKLSTENNFFSTWDDKNLGYLQQDEKYIDSVNVLEKVTNNNVSNYSPLRDFSSHSSNHNTGHYNPTTNYNPYVAESSTEQLYGSNNVVSDEPKEQKRRSLHGNFNNAGSSATSNSRFTNAIIHNKGRVVISGSEVRIRITEECVIGKYILPKNHMITGQASISGERVTIRVDGVSLNGVPVPVKFVVFATDGIKGIYCEELLKYKITDDLASESIDEGGTRIDLGQYGSISTDALKKKKNQPSVVLPESHNIILKQVR